MYQRIWTPHVGEKATMVREPGNEHDRFAVAVFEDKTLCTIGHLPGEISSQFAVSRLFFLVVQDLSLFTSFLQLALLQDSFF